MPIEIGQLKSPHIIPRDGLVRFFTATGYHTVSHVKISLEEARIGLRASIGKTIVCGRTILITCGA